MISPTAASFSLCLLAMFALRPLAIALKLIDRPGGRKIHHGDVPLVGGVAMLFGIVFGFAFVPASQTAVTSFLAGCTLLVTVGLLDDRFDLSPWTRLPVQIAAALLLIAGSDSLVTDLGAPFGGEEITLRGIAAYAFTLGVIVAAINAFNMLDGMDGLAGGAGIVALAALVFLAIDVGASMVAAGGLAVIGAVCAFLIANVPARFNRDVRCFMGDSGSTLLGFAVAWLCIKLLEYPVEAAAPVTVLWIVALPLFDFFWTITRRLLRGTSLVQPDVDHLHHLLIRAGFGVPGAFAVFAGLAAMLAVFGIAIDRLAVPEWVSLLLFGVTGMLVVRLMSRAHALRGWLPLPAKGARLTASDDGSGADV